MLSGGPDAHVLYGCGYALTPVFVYYEPPTDKALADPQVDKRNVRRQAYLLDPPEHLPEHLSGSSSVDGEGRSRDGQEAESGSGQQPPEASRPRLVGAPAVYNQPIHVVLSPGDKTIYATRGGNSVVEAVRGALACVGHMAKSQGPDGHTELGKYGVVGADPLIDLTRLASSHSAVVDLPINLVRTEEHLSGGVYMAVIAAVTGWTMDPSVRIIRLS